MSVRAGQLRHRITIKRPLGADDASQNTYGEDEGDPELIGSFWAKVVSLAGRELYQAQQRWPEARYEITMRYQPEHSITPNMFIEFGAMTIDILDVQNYEFRCDWLTITAKDRKGS